MNNPTPATPIDGAALLDEVEAFHRRFNVLPSENAYAAVVLWDAHAHLLDCFGITPRLAFLSPTPAVGKTRALGVVSTLTPNPMYVTASAARYCRALSNPDGRPTLLLDEADTACGPRADVDGALRSLLNIGHRADSVVHQQAADPALSVRTYSPYAAVALAGLGSLPESVTSRSVIIRMCQAAPTARLEPFRPSKHTAEGHALRDRLAAWADTVKPGMADARPAMPSAPPTRCAAVWEPLLAVADTAGGDWPQRARAAYTTLANETNEGRNAA
ncbi:DUF3631 domain-containing protein [Streptomyces sp. NPDC056682]|uniref:DUF3631 domain-containing protein n=1 Tax=Streptomyces sp. NPDC056682 TaxID=3345909 RepID=UPI0036B4231A